MNQPDLPDLHDLLHERVADENAPDLTGGAWTTGRRRAHRRTAGALAGVVATVAVIGGGAAWVGSRPEAGGPVVPSTQGPSPTAPVTTPAADGTFQKVPVWFSPDLAEEQQLPYVDESPLPREVDLSAPAPDATTDPLPRAVAAFRVPDAVILLGPSGELRRLPLSLPLQVDVDGNDIPPIVPGSLSPDGRHLAVPRLDEVLLFDVRAGTWRTLDVPGEQTNRLTWEDDETLRLDSLLGPFEHLPATLVSLTGERVGEAPSGAPENGLRISAAAASVWGPTRANGAGLEAQGWGGAADRMPGRSAYPAYLAVTSGGASTALLTFTDDDNRWRLGGVGTVAGWLDADTVVYDSNEVDAGRDTLVAWDVGTRTFRRVLTVVGADAISLARLDG